MENEDDVIEDIENTSEESDLDSEPIVEETIELEEEEEVVSKSEYEKLKEIAENQRIRAEKAEKKLKVETPKVEPTTSAENKNDLSVKDLYAFMEAKIPQSDIDEVIEYSKLKNIPVTEALQSSVVKAILADKAEQRSVQEASNTGTVRRGSSKISDDTLLAKASAGELPTSDEDLRRLIRLKKGLK